MFRPPVAKFQRGFAHALATKMTMAASTPDVLFLKSYDNFEKYPANLIITSTAPTVLNDYQRQIDEAASSLFRTKGEDICVPFREFDASGAGP